MAAALDVLSWALVLGGAFFTLVGALGLLRLPDVFARMHAAGMTDTMGAALILAGLCFHGDGLTAVRLLLIVAFLWFTSPISTHALARAALQGGVRPLTGAAARRGPEQARPGSAATAQRGLAPPPQPGPEGGSP